MISSWKEFVKEEQQKDYYISLIEKLKEEAKNGYMTYPQPDNILRAFKTTKLSNVKICLLGQDPYFNGMANGLAFANNEETQYMSPSLKNIFKEIKIEYGETPKDKTLLKWADQGVFLLNSILTVRKGIPASHKNFGWETFTDNAIKLLSQQKQPIVFMLWGGFARSKKSLINILDENKLILESSHPSPLSANGFFGCNHFKLANEFLKQHDIEKINWID